jgi:hypothetical protein
VPHAIWGVWVFAATGLPVVVFGASALTGFAPFSFLPVGNTLAIAVGFNGFRSGAARHQKHQKVP